MHEHDWRKINENSDGILEVCQVCKKRLITKKEPKTQRIDNKKYVREHRKDLAQPNGRTSKIFNKYYGFESGYISRFKK